MLKSDLKQIKNIIKDELVSNNKKNNALIFSKIEEVAINTNQSIDELRREMNERFERVNERFEKIDERFEEVHLELEKKVSRQDLLDWDFGMGISSDIDKLKFLHIDELKTLPNRNKIKQKLLANNL